MVRAETNEHEEMIVVMTTVADGGEAQQLAEGLVGEKLAACVQIMPPMTSVYVWKNEVRRETEHLLLVKTTAEKFDEVEEFIQRDHSYDTPEIISITADKVSEKYLNWAGSQILASDE